MMQGMIMQPGEGERLHNERRRRFWKTVGVLAACGAFAGFFGGLAVGYEDGGGSRHLPLLRTIAAITLVIGMFAAAYGSWRFFQQVDELEVADNLWGSLVGFYIYALLFPTWWMLAKLERAPEPNDWVIFAAAMLGGGAFYAYRKWQLR